MSLPMFVSICYAIVCERRVRVYGARQPTPMVYAAPRCLFYCRRLRAAGHVTIRLLLLRHGLFDSAGDIFADERWLLMVRCRRAMII